MVEVVGGDRIMWIFFSEPGGARVSNSSGLRHVVNDPYSISSQNGVLTARFILAHSVDQAGYTHYCYKYNAAGQIVEAPTLRLNPGDTLNLEVVNRIKNTDGERKMKMKMRARPDRPAAMAATRRSIPRTYISMA